jgi:flavin reductase
MDMTTQDIFRHSMRRLATTVSVVTCARDGIRHGMTATAVTALCMEPASLIVCVNAKSSFLAPLRRERRFRITFSKANNPASRASSVAKRRVRRALRRGSG